MGAFLLNIYQFFQQRKKLFWSLLCIIVAFLGILSSQLKFVTNINELIPSNEKIDIVKSYTVDNDQAQVILFGVATQDTSNTNTEALINIKKEYHQAIMAHCKPYLDTNYDANVSIQKYYQLLLNNLPFFLNEADWKYIEHTLKPALLKEKMKRALDLASDENAGAYFNYNFRKDPLGLMKYPLSHLEKLKGDGEVTIANNEIFNTAGNAVLFNLKSRFGNNNIGENKPLVAHIDSINNRFTKQYPEYNFYTYGGPIVAVGNANQMTMDTIITLSITIVGLFLLTSYAFKRKRITLLMFTPVIFGILFSLGLSYIVQGQLSLMAIGIGAVILGIALDFSIHFINHWKHEGDIAKTIQHIAKPLTLGAITTIGAFVILQFAAAPILNDLGLFASFGLLGAVLFTLIALPHLLPNTPTSNINSNPTLIDKLSHTQPEKNKWLILLILIITPILYHYSKQIKFDGDLQHMNFLSKETRLAEQFFDKTYHLTSSNGFIIPKDIKTQNNIEQTLADLIKEEKIFDVNHNSNLLPSTTLQTERINRWNNYWTSEKVANYNKIISEVVAESGINFKPIPQFNPAIYQQQQISASDYQILKQVHGFYNHNQPHQEVITYKANQDYRDEVITTLNHIDGVVAADSRYITESILHYVIDDFNQLVFYSGLLVFIALLIAYGRIELALISFIPMAISWIWILGIMTLLQIPFNFVNIIICTLIFGLGDDYSIFMTDSLIEQYKKGQKNLNISRSAIYFSALTTVLGLGVLIFAQHPVLRSIAIIAVLGLSAVVLISQVLQPLLFNILIIKRAQRGQLPFTAYSLIKTILAYTYFLIGCFITTIVGLILLPLKPFGEQKSKLYFHQTLSFFTRSTLFLMGNVLKHVKYEDPSVLHSPSVWVANHSSFLDILIVTALQPKAVLLTAEWVWKNPFFGKIVKMAEYYPVVNGAEESLTHLKKLTEKGYSVIVFPEGTRSKTDVIHRFKKGAFYIAYELNLPVVPVTIHGAHYNIEKGDFLLKNGSVTVEVGAAIQPSHFENYSLLSKHTQKILRTNLLSLKQNIETPTYFKEYLIKSHIYKGPVLEWYTRVKSKMEYYYEPFHTIVPKSGLIYDLGCGYGFMSFMLHWSSTQRHILGIDYDEEKIVTAQHHLYFDTEQYHFLTAQNNNQPPLSFFQGDLTAISLQPCEAIIISDALHYLLPNEQWRLLELCYNALLPGGKLIIRDGVTDMKERHQHTERTEKYSTEIIKFNKTKNELTFISKSSMEAWAQEKGFHLTIHDFYKKLSNLTFEFEKR